MGQTVFIHIGELYASKKPSVITTLLGSCVSTCLFDPVAKIGGMNHILSVNKPTLNTNFNSARYGINAMEQLINEMVKLGGVRSRFCAKIFGGGILLKMSKENSPGPLNVAFVKQYLKDENIDLLAENTGGSYSRRLFFHTDTSEVLLKRSAVGSMKDFEKSFVSDGAVRVKSIARKPGEVTLFD